MLLLLLLLFTLHFFILSTSAPTHQPSLIFPNFHSFSLSMSWCIFSKLIQLEIAGGVFESVDITLFFFFLVGDSGTGCEVIYMLDLHFLFLLHGVFVFGGHWGCFVVWWLGKFIPLKVLACLMNSCVSSTSVLNISLTIEIWFVPNLFINSCFLRFEKYCFFFCLFYHFI